MITTTLHTADGVTYMDMYPSKLTGGTVHFARAVWPDDEVLRVEVVVELLRHVGKAIRDGRISLEHIL